MPRPKSTEITATDPAVRRLMENIERLMVERGIRSWAALAKKAHVSPVTLMRNRSGEQEPGEQTIIKIADALKVTPDELRGGMARPPSEPSEEDIFPGKQSFSRRMQIKNSAMNALAMVALRYNITPAEIIESAPLMFCIMAEESLKRRSERLAEVDTLIGAVEDARTNFPHIPPGEFFHWSEGLDAERKSIRGRDLFGKVVDETPIHHSSDGYDTDDDNPFVAFLRSRAEALEGIEVKSWSTWNGPAYVVAEEQALEYVGGNAEAAKAIIEGSAPVNKMRELTDRDNPEARAAWAIEKARTFKAESDAALDAILARAVAAAGGPFDLEISPDEDFTIEGGDE